MTLLNIEKHIIIGTSSEITIEEEKEIFDLCRQVLRRKNEKRRVWLVGQCEKYDKI